MTRDALFFAIGGLVGGTILFDASSAPDKPLVCSLSAPVELPEHGIKGPRDWEEFVREQFSRGQCK